MTGRMVNYIALALISVFGGVYLYLSSLIAIDTGSSTLGPSFFPMTVGTILIGLCAIAAVRQLRASDEALQINRKREIMLTVLLVAIYIFAWERLGYFYFLTGALCFLLILIYSGYKMTLRHLINNISVSFVLVSVTYVIFGIVLGVRFY